MQFLIVYDSLKSSVFVQKEARYNGSLGNTLILRQI